METSLIAMTVVGLLSLLLRCQIVSSRIHAVESIPNPSARICGLAKSRTQA
jgi:hypothetical protein